MAYLISEEDYDDAIEFYSKAIEVNPFVAAYYGNRSFAYLRTECFGYALEDASKALQIDPKYIKVSDERKSQRKNEGIICCTCRYFVFLLAKI